MFDKCAESLFRPTVASSSSKSGGPASERGMSLVEVTIAALVLVVGLVSVAQLLAVTAFAEGMARNGALATRLGQGKLDDLMKANLDTNPQVQVTPGGVDSLAANVANYFDVDTAVPPRWTRRWRVQAGPAATRVVTVRTIVGQASRFRRTVDLTTLIRRW